jgi:OOP family OmpA-OmpF porin
MKNLSAFIFVSLLSLLSFKPAYAINAHDTVSSDGDKVVQTREGSCVRTKWDDGINACAPKKVVVPIAPPVLVPVPPRIVVQAPPPAPIPPRTIINNQARTVYFESNKDQLTMEAKSKLDQLAQILKQAKDIRSAAIVGFADPMGNKKYNYALSQRRAKAVENYLHQNGYTRTVMADVRAVGEDDASADCPRKLKRKQRIACLATDRKVELEVVYETLQRQ